MRWFYTSIVSDVTNPREKVGTVICSRYLRINAIMIIRPLIRAGRPFQRNLANYATPTLPSFSGERARRVKSHKRPTYTKRKQDTLKQRDEWRRKKGEQAGELEKVSSLLSNNGTTSNFNPGITSILFQFSCI